MSLVYAGPPYLLMAGAVLVWTRRPGERALPRLRVAMAVAPIALAPLVAVYVRALEYFTVADKLLYARYSEAGDMALIGIVVGYGYVVVVWILNTIRVSLHDDRRRPPAV